MTDTSRENVAWVAGMCDRAISHHDQEWPNVALRDAADLLLALLERAEKAEKHPASTNVLFEQLRLTRAELARVREALQRLQDWARLGTSYGIEDGPLTYVRSICEPALGLSVDGKTPLAGKEGTA